jgi:hypothetical protein
MGPSASNRHFDWTITSFPAAGAQATVVRAAPGAGRRHVITSVYGQYVAAGTVAAAGRTFMVLDGTTEVVTVGRFFPAITDDVILSYANAGMNYVCGDNATVTIQFDGLNANGQQCVTLTGYTI